MTAQALDWKRGQAQIRALVHLAKKVVQAPAPLQGHQLQQSHLKSEQW
jgi:hypothetical protein